MLKLYNRKTCTVTKLLQFLWQQKKNKVSLSFYAQLYNKLCKLYPEVLVCCKNILAYVYIHIHVNAPTQLLILLHSYFRIFTSWHIQRDRDYLFMILKYLLINSRSILVKNGFFISYFILLSWAAKVASWHQNYIFLGQIKS